MPETTPGPDPHQLSDKQASILEGFVGHFSDDSNRTIQHLAYYDLVAANLREFFDRFELPMETPEDYYPVMAGISIASVWLEQLVDRGLTPGQAIEVMRDGFARLAPPGCIPPAD